ncbi:hypothetical protein DMN91_003519 [Ooceraea biroi]|uniref:WD repeat-containing protein n=1 Tax=Ooceraea biroi TaxID=2015173 RepID=A0A3L8DS91_OOCBI|nr:hypothetical protein DMN91_003519 [Ooceraea biroi]
MTTPMCEDGGPLREWAPLSILLQQIPAKKQNGIFMQDISFTCIAVLPEFIAIGTNHGLIYWYNREKQDLQRLRCENANSKVTCIKVISTVDYMIAAGNEQGVITIFQIPKSPPDSLPETLKPKQKKQVERYSISGLHNTTLTAVEWSKNGMKLFSGDKDGLVVLTEIDFYMHLSKSSKLLNEKYPIIQLSYQQGLLLVSTTLRTILVNRNENGKVTQVGQKERKTLGKLGAIFGSRQNYAQEPVIYASRPGLRLWQADKAGIVLKTLIFKSVGIVPTVTVGTDVDITNAEEAVEIPPIVPINLSTPLITDINKIPEHNDTSERKKAEEARNNDRREIFQRIGQQEFEDVVFTPEKRQKKSRSRTANGNEDALSSSNTDYLSSNLDVNHANISKTTTTRSSIMQLSFDDDFILKSDRDLETIQRDVENKERLLADVLDFDLSKYMTSNRTDKDHTDAITSINCNVHSSNIVNEEQNTRTDNDSEQNDCAEIESGEEDVSYRTELQRLEDLGECRKILLQNKLDDVPLISDNSVDIRQVPAIDRDELEHQFNTLAKECATSAILEEEEDWVLVKEDIPSITMF